MRARVPRTFVNAFAVTAVLEEVVADRGVGQIDLAPHVARIP